MWKIARVYTPTIMRSIYQSSSTISRPHDYTHSFSQSSSHSLTRNITHVIHTPSTTTTSKQYFIYKFLGILYAVERVIKGVQCECEDKKQLKLDNVPNIHGIGDFPGVLITQRLTLKKKP